MRERIAAIVNPMAGRRNPLPIVSAIARLVRGAGSRFEVHLTERPGQGVEFASAVRRTADAILVVGGDGTVSEVLHGLSGAAVPIALLPAGTENLVARDLRTPGDARSLADLLLHGSPTPRDTGLVNGRLFLAVVGIGFDAECVIRLVRRRTGHISQWDYFWPTWRTFWTHRFPRLDVQLDGTTWFEGQGIVLIGMIPTYSIGLRVFPCADPTDGRLDVCILRCASRGRLLRQAWSMLRSRHTRRADCQMAQAQHLRVTADETVPMEIDGDPGGALPAEISIRPASAWLLRGRAGGSARPRDGLARRA
jgi:YegS/Rv2252/BmrU family lipid kinase